MIDIKLEKFEGPLYLLVKMIENEELDIIQVSLAKIADQYIEYIRQAEQISADELSDFLVVAARLLYIKSKALLPYIFPAEEDEGDELEKQLKMYKEYLEATKVVEAMLAEGKFMFAREFDKKALTANKPIFSPPKKVKAEDLAMIFTDLLNRLRPPEKLKEEKIGHQVSMEEKISHIQTEVAKKIRVSFNRILESAQSKTDVIVSFLAALELMRQCHIILEQEIIFGEIVMNRVV